jgi:signal transduction histidine kinase
LEELNYRDLFEHSPGLYLVLDPDFTIVAVTNAYLSATMTVREEITGRDIFDVFPDNPDDVKADGVSKLRASLIRVRDTKKADIMAIQKYDIRKPAAKGGGFEVRYWSPFNSPVLGKKQKLKFIIHRVEDVTEFVMLKMHDAEQSQITEELKKKASRMEIELLKRSKELQKSNFALTEVIAELKNKAAELERSNNELSHFAATASHDIKAPFRSVGGYLEIIKDKLRDTDDRQIIMAFERISAARLRIATLLDDLLNFSRIDKEDAELEEVDLSEVLKDVLRNLEFNIREKNAKVNITGKMPVVQGYRFQLEQLFQNLIANGLKFNLNPGPQVTVSVERKDKFFQFSIRDNGIGIEAEYFNKVFMMFERLHGPQDYAGTGLGLAICKKIVEYHHGKIWLESEPGSGSTFFFTIPEVVQGSLSE